MEFESPAGAGEEVSNGKTEGLCVAMNSRGAFGRSWLWWMVFVFILFFVLGNPEQAASIVRQGVSLLMTAGEAAVTFLQGVFRDLGQSR